MDRFDLPDKRWRIVKDWIIRQIDSGEWPADTKLPSIRALTRMFETSITTVQRALADLEADAYVSTVPGLAISSRLQARRNRPAALISPVSRSTSIMRWSRCSPKRLRALPRH
ncbi:winged helix-turn-helix domain-containing protein [Pseudomonas sp. H22_DOA]|nr:winged helix-turn-helix domain-containing protein [Pseudomonas sp. H22_DOA]